MPLPKKRSRVNSAQQHIKNLGHESNFTSDMATNEIVLYRKRKLKVKYFANHSQFARRVVKLETNASYKVCELLTNGFIHACKL